MFCIKKNIERIWIYLIPLFLFVFNSSCTNGIQSGMIAASFIGINKATPISPTAVRVTWAKSNDYQYYDIYSDISKTPILTDQIFGEAFIENLTPGTTYKFKVLGKGSTTGAGNDREIAVTTWNRFTGITATTKDGDGNIEISWDYKENVTEYYIFLNEETTPTEASTAGWKTPTVTTTSSRYLFSGLKGSTNYYFVVHTKYRNGEYERPAKFLTNTTKSSFGALDSWVVVPRITIGALPSFSVNIPSNPVFALNNFTTSIFKDHQPVSDPLIGRGKIPFSSGINFNLGRITGISTQINYRDASKGIDETYTIPNQETYLKGLLPQLDVPPSFSSESALGAAYLGKSSNRGDFNCDGFDDLAVGMPDATVGTIGSTYRKQGAVYVYYGGQKFGDRYYLRTSSTQPQTRPGVITPNPQLISFPDLTEDSKFGYALTSGNINGDKSGSYGCEDLAVGAPGMLTKDGYQTGSVFVFFGSKNGLKISGTVSAISENSPTCNGLIDDASCSSVILWPDPMRLPASVFGGVYGGRQTHHASFGKALAFIGDFDANGYGDLAIGAPNAPWDGDLSDFTLPTGFAYWDVGYVALFFGSSYGFTTVTPTNNLAEPFPYLKIYPPIAQTNMYFGSSIAGNADVDGKNRRIVNGVKVGGPDFVIGAPGYSYVNPKVGATYPMQDGDANTTLVVSMVPSDGAWWGADTTTENAFTNPYGLANSKGAAFLYFGREEGVASDSVFWKCGKRGSSAATHFSCLTDSQRFRMLFPRDGESKGFGSAVAMLGDPAAKDQSNLLLCSGNTRFLCRDANGDGYADIIIAASSAGSTGKPSTGALWEFFGNSSRLFERGIVSTTTQDQFTGIGNAFYLTSPQCTAFRDTALCQPTRLRPNSVPSNTRLGQYASSISTGDINRDGLLDVILGGPGYNPDGLQPDAGGIFVFSSSRNYGITPNFSVFTKTTSLNSNKGYDQLGYSVVAGDFDSTGPKTDYLAYNIDTNILDLNALSYNDVVGGAPFDEIARNGGGAAHIFYSGGAIESPTILPSALSTTKILNSTPIETLIDTVAAAQDSGYGFSRIVGDVNGDGFDDAVAQVQGLNNQSQSGYTGIIYYGSTLGLITTEFCLNNLSRIFISGTDLNNALYCQPSISQPIGIVGENIVLPHLMRRPNNVASTWGNQAFPAGDVNGDGFDDVLFVDPFQQPSSILLYFGSRSGLQDIVVPANNPSSSDPQIVSKKISLVSLIQGDLSFNAASTINDFRNNNQITYGDFNSDGYSDVVISNPLAYGPKLTSPTLTSDGQSISILQASGTPYTSPDGTWLCPATELRSTECKGSAPYDHGAMYIFYGSPLGLQTPLRINGTDIDQPENTVNLYKTELTANSSQRTCNPTTGVCKVGYLRNPVFFNSLTGYGALQHNFGSNLTVMNYNATASGVPVAEGDSGEYDDLLVASPFYENPGCTLLASSAPERNQGRIFLFAGSKWGLVAADYGDYWPSGAGEIEKCTSSQLGNDETGLGFSLDPTVKIRALRMPIAPLGTNKTTRNFAFKMTSAGDINGDGQEDFAVAAPNETVQVNGNTITNGGAVYVYYGPLCPADNDFDVLSSIQNSESGGQYYSINIQRTLTELGVSSATKGSCGAKNLAPLKVVVKDADANNKKYGTTLIGGRKNGTKNKTDINGELLFPLSDLVVGTPYYNDTVAGANTIGRGVIFFGSAPNGIYPGGLFSDDYPSYVVETISGTKVKPYILQKPKTPDIRFFLRGVTTGDVNNDGSMDLMIPTNDYDQPSSSSGSGVQGVNMGALLMFF
jgi:hypothetical protein